MKEQSNLSTKLERRRRELTLKKRERELQRLLREVMRKERLNNADIGLP